MTVPIRPTLHALVQAAVDATNATSGWLLRLDGDDLVVVAGVGAGAADALGSRRPVAGTAGFVASSGQPAAIGVRGEDTANEGAGGVARPTSLLAAPCGDDDIVGVLEVADASAGSFSFDDVEIVSLLADVAGAALAEGDDLVAQPPSPQALAADLDLLSRTDPARYVRVARAVEAMLG